MRSLAYHQCGPGFGSRTQGNREFNKRRRLWQRKRQNAVILLVKRGKNERAARVARVFQYISLPYSSKQQRKMTNFQVLTTTSTNNSESFLLSLCFKCVRTNLVIAYFAHVVHHKQDGNIVKHLRQLKLIV